MPSKFDAILGELREKDVSKLTNPLQFKGIINYPADFPTLAEVQPGWFYIVTSDVTDDDPTKTNTGQSFLAGDEIVWDGSQWVVVGSDLSYVGSFSRYFLTMGA